MEWEIRESELRSLRPLSAFASESAEMPTSAGAVSETCTPGCSTRLMMNVGMDGLVNWNSKWRGPLLPRNNPQNVRLTTRMAGYRIGSIYLHLQKLT